MQQPKQSIVEMLLGPAAQRTPQKCLAILPQLFDLAVGGRFAPGESLRLTSPDIVAEMVDSIFMKVPVPARVQIIRNLEALVLASPFNGKLLASARDVGLVQKLLGLLQYIEEQELFDRVLHLAHLLCAHNMTIKDVKKYFGVMHHIAESGMEAVDYRSKFYNLVVSLQQTIQKEVRPSAFTDFDGLRQVSGVQIPHQLTFPKYSYSFSCWMRAETFVDPAQGTAYLPRLFSFTSADDGSGLEAYFYTHATRGTSLVVQFSPPTSGKKKPVVAHLSYGFRPQRWYQVTISHTYSLVMTSELKLYVDGAKATSTSLRYPSISKPLDNNYIGTNRYRQDGYQSSFCGQIGQVYMFKQALGSKEVNHLYKLGCDFSLCFANKGYFLANKELYFAYCPRASDGDTLFDTSFEVLEKAVKGKEPFHATMLAGTRLIAGQSVRNSIFCAGGMEIILPLLIQPFVFAEKNRSFYGEKSAPWGAKEQEQLGHFQAVVINLIADLVHGHKAFQNELNSSKAFSLIALLLERHAPLNMCNQMIVALERLVRNLGQRVLVKQVHQELLFSFRLWQAAPFDVQVEGFSMLNRFVLKQPEMFREIIGVQVLMDSLRTFYWIVEDPAGANKPATLTDRRLSNAATPPRGGDSPQNQRKKSTVAAQWLRESGNSLVGVESDNKRRFSPAEIRRLRMHILGMLRTMLSAGVTKLEMQAIVFFLQDCTDAYQLEDVLYLVLYLLHSTNTFKKIVEHLHDLGSIHTFLDFVGHKKEAIRVLALRIIALMHRILPKKVGKILDSDCYSYITGKLQQYPFEPLTYIALLEVATGFIRVEYTNMTAEFVTTVKTFHCKEFLAVMFKLVPSAELTMRQRALQDFSLMLMNSFEARQAFVDQVGFPKWLLSILADSLRSQHEDSHASVELVLRLLDFLLQHCLKIPDGWKTLETFAAFTNLYSRGSEDVQIQQAFYEHMMAMCSEELRKLDQGAYSDQVLLTNFAHAACLIEEFLFFPPDAITGNGVDVKVTLKRVPGTKKWADFVFAQSFLDLLDSLVLSPHADTINQELLSSDKEKNIYCLILRLILVSMRESQAVFADAPSSDRMAAGRMGKNSSRLEPGQTAHVGAPGSAPASGGPTLSVRPIGGRAGDPTFYLFEDELQKSSQQKFLDKSAHRLKFLLGNVMRSSGANLNPVRYLTWALSYLIKTLRKGVQGQAMLHRPTVHLFKEIVRDYGAELQAFLGEPFPNAPGLEITCTEEEFYRYFDEMDHQYSLQFHIEEAKNGIEEELALQLPDAAKRRAKMMLSVTETIKNLSSVNFEKEQKDKVDQVRSEHAYLEVNRRISWLMAEAERFHKLEYLWDRFYLYVSHNESYLWLTAEKAFKEKFWALDPTEDPMRRRWKLKQNYDGRDHKEYSQAYIRQQLNSQREEAEAEAEAAAAAAAAAALKANRPVPNPLAMASDLIHSVSIPLPASPAPGDSSSALQSPAAANEAEGADESEEKEEAPADWCMVDLKEEMRPTPFLLRTTDETPLLNVACDLISPQQVVPGTLDITDKALYFFASDAASANELSREGPAGARDASQGEAGAERNWSLDRKWPISYVRGIHRRRYMLRNTALEIFLLDQRNFLVDFASGVREKVFSALVGAQPPNLVDYTNKKTPQEILKKSDITGKWQRREISNFEYLMYLNTVAGRTYNDLSQYPVFPWILSDYTSPTINLADPGVYRDLSKPVGALNPKRLAEFEVRYENLPNDDDSMPRFYYGSHYSTALVVQYYLIRMEPFTTLYLQLQGRFDHADRMFDSVATAWTNSFTLAQDVKELTPEFFYNTMFFKNSNRLDLGEKQTGEQIGDVQLPPWAHGKAEEFVRINREALESDIVSQNLHLWIDLIFGASQRGKRAEAAKNIFYHLTYEGAVNIDAIEDPVLRQSTMEQILCFGQCPSQLFTKPHVSRKPLNESVRSVFDDPSIFMIAGEQDLKLEPRLLFCSGDKVAAVSRSGQFRLLRAVCGPSGASQVSFNSLHLALATPLCAVSMSNALIPTNLNMPKFVVDVDTKCMISFCYWDCSIRVCSLQTSVTVIQSVRMHKAAVSCVVPSESFRVIVSGSLDGTLMVWRVDRTKGRSLALANKPRFVLRGHTAAISCVAVSERLDVVVSGSESGTLAVHTLHSGRYVRSFLDSPSEGFHKGGIDFIVVTTLAQVVAYSHSSNWLVVYDINGNLLASSHLTGAKLPVKHMIATSDGKYLVVAGRQLHIYNTHSLELVKSFAVGEEILTVTFLLEERFLALGLKSGRLVACCMLSA